MGAQSISGICHLPSLGEAVVPNISCGHSGTPAKKLDAADAAFVGRVVESSTDAEGTTQVFEVDGVYTITGGTLAAVNVKADEATQAAAVKWIDFFYLSKLLDQVADPDPRLDCQRNLHMNFYAVTLGTLGEMYGSKIL